MSDTLILTLSLTLGGRKSAPTQPVAGELDRFEIPASLATSEDPLHRLLYCFADAFERHQMIVVTRVMQEMAPSAKE